MLLSAVKAHHLGLIKTDRLRWMPSYPWAKSINLIAASSFTFSVCLTCSVFALAPNREFRCETCSLLLFLSRLHVSPSSGSLSSNWVLLCFDISHEQTESPWSMQRVQFKTRTQGSTKLPTTPRLSLHYTSWSDSSNVLVRPCWHPWHENRDSFVTCFLFWDWLCREKTRLAVSYS